MNPPVLEMPTVTKPPVFVPSIGDSLRLNLGGAGEGYRSGKIPGFKTVDLREGTATDIVADVSDLSFLPDESVLELYSSNVLEHFPHTKTQKVLSEWCRVLKRGGKLWLSVPDFEASVQLYLKNGLVPWVSYLIWGDQAHPLNYHYINFTFSSLALEASKAGFSDIKRVQSLPYGVIDASEIRDNRFNIKVSLNVECTK
jgi:predicted SAM-dependent methyltransferase